MTNILGPHRKIKRTMASAQFFASCNYLLCVHTSLAENCSSRKKSMVRHISTTVKHVCTSSRPFYAKLPLQLPLVDTLKSEESFYSNELQLVHATTIFLSNHKSTQKPLIYSGTNLNSRFWKSKLGQLYRSKITKMNSAISKNCNVRLSNKQWQYRHAP